MRRQISVLQLALKKHVFLGQFLFLFLASISLYSQEHFEVVVLGCGGGPIENNLSGYLIAPKGSNSYVALDAGTLLAGIMIAEEENAFNAVPTRPSSALTPEGEILRNRIKAYLISHAHLDHVAGLVINSPADTQKPIFGIPSTIDNIKDHLFNWKICANFGSEGDKPLNKYKYQRLKIGQTVQIPDTAMTVEAFPLSHQGNHLSTAFLIESKGAYILYLGIRPPIHFLKKNAWSKSGRERPL